MINSDNVEQFRKLFVEFENITKKKTNYKFNDTRDAINELANKRIIPYFNNRDFLHFCRDCRNRISHVNDDFKYIIYTDEFIKKLDDIIELIKKPPTALSMATKNVTSATTFDNVKKYMELMAEKNYTHIPIYDDNKLIGVFSENCIFNYLLKEECVVIDDKMTFNDIKDYINIDYAKEYIIFKSEKDDYNKIVNSFMIEFEKGCKLSCVMITENGKFGEKVKGILTSWDILGRKNYD